VEVGSEELTLQAVVTFVTHTTSPALIIAGMLCHGAANGIYLLQPASLNGAPHYMLNRGGRTSEPLHLYWTSSFAACGSCGAWVLGSDTEGALGAAFRASISSSSPMFGVAQWSELCDSNGRLQTNGVSLKLTPEYAVQTAVTRTRTIVLSQSELEAQAVEMFYATTAAQRTPVAPPTLPEMLVSGSEAEAQLAQMFVTQQRPRNPIWRWLSR
jgi:hypothetical protein